MFSSREEKFALSPWVIFISEYFKQKVIIFISARGKGEKEYT